MYKSMVTYWYSHSCKPDQLQLDSTECTFNHSVVAIPRQPNSVRAGRRKARLGKTCMLVDVKVSC